MNKALFNTKEQEKKKIKKNSKILNDFAHQHLEKKKTNF